MQVQVDIGCKGFKVVHLNVRSLKKKIDEINTLAHRFNIVIFTCSESWLHAGIESTCLAIPNYNIYRWDRSWMVSDNCIKKGGGLVTFVNKKYIVDDRMYLQLNESSQDLEAQVLYVKKVNNKGTVIINAYRPPGGNQSIFIEKMNGIMTSLQNTRYADIYLTGDLNLDHTPESLNETTSNLISLLESYGLNQVIMSPTRVTHTSQTILDVMNVKTSKIINGFIFKSALSDHYLVGTIRNLNYHLPSMHYIYGRSYKNYTFEHAKSYYDRQRRDLIYDEDVELAWRRLFKYMVNCANALCPYQQMLVRQESPPWITREIVEAIHERDAAFETAFSTGDPQDMSRAKELRTSTKRDIRNARADYIRENLDNNSDNPRKFWEPN